MKGFWNIRNKPKSMKEFSNFYKVVVKNQIVF